jgi:hypothetical protein
MFGSVLEKLDGWFGKSFVVASLLPVLIFGGANVLMVGFVFPRTLNEIIDYFTASPFAPLSFTVAFLIACAIVAYATDPWARWTMGILRGANWPRPLATMGIADECVTLESLNDERDRSADLRERVTETACNALIGRLIEARFKGLALQAISRADLIDAASNAMRDIERARNLGEPIDLPLLESTVGTVADALKLNCAEITKLITIEQGSFAEGELCRRLDRLHRRLEMTIEYARKQAESRWTMAVNASNSRMARNSVAPTAIGNSFAALNGYLDEAFSIDIDFFLPIIRIVLTKDKETADLLSAAQRSLDFASRALVLVLLFTIVWLPTVVVESKSVLAVAAVATFGLIGAIVMVEMVRASFDNYSEVIRAICILKRFEVLTALHMKLPGDWRSERDLWKSINDQLQWGSATPGEINYEHSAK